MEWPEIAAAIADEIEAMDEAAAEAEEERRRADSIEEARTKLHQALER